MPKINFYASLNELARHNKSTSVKEKAETGTHKILSPSSLTLTERRLMSDFLDYHQKGKLKIMEAANDSPDDFVFKSFKASAIPNATFMMPMYQGKKPMFVTLLQPVYQMSTYNPNEHSYYFSTELLGKGAYGAVHAAVELKHKKSLETVKTSKQAAAVKSSNMSKDYDKKKFDTPSVAADKAAWRDFKALELITITNSEAKLLHTLDKQKTKPLFSFDQQGKVESYIAMQRAEGMTLSDFIYTPKDKLPLALSDLDYVKIMLAVATELKKFHAKDLVHLDLKPANIMIDFDGYEFTAKIIDFGFMAKRGRPQYSGTPEYMHPHILRGGVHGSGKTVMPVEPHHDLFSLGVLFNNLLQGTDSFDDIEKNPELQNLVNTNIRQGLTQYYQSTKNKRTLSKPDELNLSTEDSRQRVVNIINECINTDLNKIPTIDSVIHQLGSLKHSLEKNKIHADVMEMVLDTAQQIDNAWVFEEFISDKKLRSNINAFSAINFILNDSLKKLPKSRDEEEKGCALLLQRLGLEPSKETALATIKDYQKQLRSALANSNEINYQLIAIQQFADYAPNSTRNELLKEHENSANLLLNQFSTMEMSLHTLPKINDVLEKLQGHEEAISTSLNDDLLTKAKQGIHDYLNLREKENFFSKIVHQSGRERAKYYLQQLNSTNIPDKTLILYALLADRKGGTILKKHVVKQLGFPTLDLAKNYMRKMLRLQANHEAVAETCNLPTPPTPAEFRHLCEMKYEDIRTQINKQLSVIANEANSSPAPEKNNASKHFNS